MERRREEKGHAVLEVLVRAMKKMGEMEGLTGDQKKCLVLQTLEYELDLPEPLESLIIALIDILIEVENGNLTFNKKIKSKAWKAPKKTKENKTKRNLFQNLFSKSLPTLPGMKKTVTTENPVRRKDSSPS